ncbi:MAG: DEAD/DEAH box helicase [Labilithrix sp.]|nr:DEAD/DEAH box helicase [Labilithrix sp.]
MAVTDFEELIGPLLASALEKKGYTNLTPVQEAVLDPALAGKDLRISSQTGSGKTVAIGLALRDVVQGDTSSTPKGAARPRALVVTPTRELAQQVEGELSWLFAPLRMRVASVTGGANYRDERRALGSGPTIVVGTPGRLLDHLQRKAIDGSQLGAVVLDEADRMLDLGFRDDLEAILGFAPEEHRTHLCSATFAREVTALADRVQRDAVRVEGTPHGTANLDIEHLVHLVLPNERLAAIINLMLATPDAPTLVFARTRADVAELTQLLADTGFRVDSLSGEMEQRERNRALAAFKRGDLHALVATDVAARGIDVQDVGRVIHAEPPGDADAYTHRSGRTGRAGRKGTSSVLVSPQAMTRTSFLLKRAGVRWRIEPLPTPAQILEARDERLFEALTTKPPPRNDDDVDGDAAKTVEEADDRAWALAKKIAATGEATRALARLIARARTTVTEPRDLTPVAPRGLRPDRGPKEPREPRESREQREARAPREPREPRPVAAQGANGGAWVPFRVTWGQMHGADARRLLAMMCRRGGIRGSDVGAIHVARTHSIVEIAAPAAASFEQATREPDPRDPRVKIQPMKGEERPAAPPPPEAPRAPRAPADRPSRSAAKKPWAAKGNARLKRKPR